MSFCAIGMILKEWISSPKLKKYYGGGFEEDIPHRNRSSLPPPPPNTSDSATSLTNLAILGGSATLKGAGKVMKLTDKILSRFRPKGIKMVDSKIPPSMHTSIRLLSTFAPNRLFVVHGVGQRLNNSFVAQLHDWRDRYKEMIADDDTNDDDTKK